MLVAVIAIIVPVFNYAPKLYLWFIRQRVHRLYRRLRIVDKDLIAARSLFDAQALQTELESIARSASILPMRNSELFFELGAHVERTRAHLGECLQVQSQPKVRLKSAVFDLRQS